MNSSWLAQRIRARRSPKIVNLSRLPTSVVRAGVMFALRDRDVVGAVYLVTVKNTTKVRGGGDKAYSGRCWAHGQVLVSVGPDSRFPCVGQHPHLTDGPKMEFADAIEALVAVAAHEFQHTRQFVHGARKSERDCELAALRTLEAFRKVRAELLAPGLLRELDVAAAREARAAADVEARPERELEKLRDKVKAWRTRIKRATTMLKKWERRLKRAEKAAAP